MTHKRRSKKITVTFTTPTLTGKKVHSVTITDTSNWITCEVLSVSGDRKIVKKEINGKNVFGYAWNNLVG